MGDSAEKIVNDMVLSTHMCMANGFMRASKLRIHKNGFIKILSEYADRIESSNSDDIKEFMTLESRVYLDEVTKKEQ
jgi:hypothetical protein